MQPDLGKGLANDRGPWQQLFETQAKRLNLMRRSLGDTLGQPLWFCEQLASLTAIDAGHVPQRLPASGFYGEEPAGPWGLASLPRQLQQSVLDSLRLSLLPLLNATGFAAGTRFNAAGVNLVVAGRLHAGRAAVCRAQDQLAACCGPCAKARARSSRDRLGRSR